MGRSIGEVLRDGKTVAFFVYNESVDQVYSRKLYDSGDAAVDSLPSKGEDQPNDNWHECCCGAPPVPALLHNGGIHWPGHICLSCKRIVTGLAPFGVDSASDNWGFGQPWHQTPADIAKTEAEPRFPWRWSTWWQQVQQPKG